jgi:hypothetical protein
MTVIMTLAADAGILPLTSVDRPSAGWTFS